MQNAISAHVCTPGRVPILGVIEGAGCDVDDLVLKWNQAYKDGTRPPLFPADTKFIPIAPPTEAIPDNWPGQHLRMLPSIPRTHDANAALHQHRTVSDMHHYTTDDGRVAAAAYRHDNKHRQKWTCWLFIRDSSGAEWNRDFPAVTDDFGWLVEVPAC